MSFRQDIVLYSKGMHMDHFWKLWRKYQNCSNRFLKDIYSFRVSRCARKHGGYIGLDAKLADWIRLPHGLMGVFISRYATIGKEVWIYQNVTIGEVNGKAPTIGARVLIGANAVLIGDITVGDDAKIGAGAVVSQDVPAGATVVSQKPRVILKQDKA